MRIRYARGWNDEIYMDIGDHTITLMSVWMYKRLDFWIGLLYNFMMVLFNASVLITVGYSLYYGIYWLAAFLVICLFFTSRRK